MVDVQAIKDNLLKVCKDHTLKDNLAVLRKPYIPYIPDDWNGLLLLSESQNLLGYPGYAEKLKSAEIDPLLRLYKGENGLGIMPWDDGTLKFAVACAFGPEEVGKCGVSNAVVWSESGKKGKNKNPGKQLRDLAVDFWVDVFKILKPKTVITVGAKAREVIKKTKYKSVIEWASASPRVLSSAASLFDEYDLLTRYEKVSAMKNTCHEYLVNSITKRNSPKNKLVYACGAVSRLKETQNTSFS